MTKTTKKTPLKKKPSAKDAKKPRKTKVATESVIDDKAPDDKAKAGRPPIELSEEQVKQIEGLASVLNCEQMADYLGIGRSTFFEIMNRDERISGLYKRGKSSAIAHVAKSLISKARAGDTKAQIFFLKTQAGWKGTDIVDHKSSDGSMSPKDMTADELRDELAKHGITITE